MRADTAWRRAAWQVAGGYFWYYAAVGAFVPYIALYYRELDFSGLQIGILTALPSIGVAFGGPLLGAFADRAGAHRLVLRTGLLVAAALALLGATLHGFAALALVMAGIALALAAVPPLLDSYAVIASERAGSSYGAVRVWGSVGYILVVLTIGRVMGDQVSALVLVGYAALLGLALLTVARLPGQAERRAQPLLSGIGEMFGNRPMTVLLVVAFFVATGSTFMNIYLGIHLQGIGAGAGLVGLAFAVSAISELPVIAFGGRLLARLGAVRLATIGVAVYGLRYAAISAITVPEWVLGVQAFHGLSYGAFLIASVTLAHRLAGHGHAATAQAVLTAMSYGFGAIFGSLVAGALLDAIGTAGLFRAAAALMVVALSVLIVGNRLVGLDRPAPMPANQP